MQERHIEDLPRITEIEEHEAEPKELEILYSVSNLSLAGPRFPQPLFWNQKQTRAFLEEAGFDGIDFIQMRNWIPFAQGVLADNYQADTGSMITSAQQSFRSEGKPEGTHSIADVRQTIREIREHDKPVAAAYAFLLLPHRDGRTGELHTMRQTFGDTFPITVEPTSDSFNTPEKIKALGGTVLVQLNKSLIQELKVQEGTVSKNIENADDLKDALEQHGISGIILDTTLFQEDGVIETLSRRREQNNETVTSEPLEKAIHNIFEMGLLGDDPIIHCAFGKSDLEVRIPTTANDLSNIRSGTEGKMTKILESIGKEMRLRPKKYHVVLETNPLDFQATIPANTIFQILRKKDVVDAFIQVKARIDALLKAGTTTT